MSEIDQLKENIESLTDRVSLLEKVLDQLVDKVLKKEDSLLERLIAFLVRTDEKSSS